MRVMFRMSAIVAALAIFAAGTLAGCGQRGPLYMPVVPPLPPKPDFQTQSPANAAKPTPESATGATAAPIGTVPDTSGTPMPLTPDDQMDTKPAEEPQPASDALPPQ